MQDEKHFTFYPYEVLLARDSKEVMAQAAYLSRILKAALLRATDRDDSVIGFENDPDGSVVPEKVYRWNFKNPDNVAFVERQYLGYAELLLRACQARGFTSIPALWGPEVLYAVEKQSLSNWSFTEIQAILHPQPPMEPRTATILPFRRPPSGPQPA